MDFRELLNSIDSEIYQRLKTAVELGRWPDGRQLTKEQQALTLQAIIAYERKHLPPEQHSGYIAPKPTSCKTAGHDEEQSIHWRD